MNYKPVLKEFRKDQADFKLLKREGDVALLQKIRGDYCGFEVVVIQKHNGYEMMGKVVPPSEFYPSSEQWGTYGFSFLPSDREGAERKFQELLEVKSIPKEIGKQPQKDSTKKPTIKLTLKK